MEKLAFTYKLMTIEIEKLTFTNKPTPKSKGVLCEKTKLTWNLKTRVLKKFLSNCFYFVIWSCLFYYLVVSLSFS
jgi:hypothetical protein